MSNIDDPDTAPVSRDGAPQPSGAPLRRFRAFHTDDPDAAEAGGGRVFSAHRLLVPADRDFSATVHAVTLGEIRLIFMRYAAPVDIQSRAPLGYYSVHQPLHGRGHVHYGADGVETETDAHTAAVFSPTDEPRMHWTGDLEQLAIKIPRDAVEDHLRMLTAQPLDAPLVFAHRMGDQGQEHRWTSVLRMVVDVVDRLHDRHVSPVLARQLEQMLLSGLVLAQPHNYTDRLAEPVTSVAPRAVGQAAELMRAHPESPWTLADLARQTGTSIRSLQEGFRRTHGTTPTRFLRDVRLDRARALLLDDTTEPRRVTDIAHELGFSHPGRFSAAYRQRFGVPPTHRGPPSTP